MPWSARPRSRSAWRVGRKGKWLPHTHEIDLVTPRRAVFEPVSPRLKDSLIFPAKNCHLSGLRYSPDGTRIIAGEYQSGVIQVWDARSGKQLVKIDSGARNSSFFSLAGLEHGVCAARKAQCHYS